MIFYVFDATFKLVSNDLGLIYVTLLLLLLLLLLFIIIVITCLHVTCLSVYVIQYIITFSGSAERVGRKAVGSPVGRNAAGLPAEGRFP